MARNGEEYREWDKYVSCRVWVLLFDGKKTHEWGIAADFAAQSLRYVGEGEQRREDGKWFNQWASLFLFAELRPNRRGRNKTKL